MIISSISDIHAAHYNPKGIETLKRFLNNRIVNSSDVVVFLGDIFDFMVGDYEEYLDEWGFFFDWIKINSTRKEIHFVEGNHDFHLRDLFNRNFPQVTYHRSGFYKEDAGKIIYFDHGDDIEIDNDGYKRYKKIIRSRFVKTIAKGRGVPFSLAQKIGTRASLRNKDIEQKYLPKVNSEAIKEKYRLSFVRVIQKSNVDFVFCGHGHIMDLYSTDDVYYVNNGYAPATQHFSVYEDGKVRLVELAIS